MCWLWIWWAPHSNPFSIKLWESFHLSLFLYWSIKWFKESNTFTTDISFIVISNLIISVSDWTKPVTKFSFSILVLLKDTFKEMESTFHTEKERTWQEQQGMLQLTHIWVSNKHAEMIWKVLVMFVCTFWEECCHGKDSRPTIRGTSMNALKRRNWQPQLKSYARAIQWSSQSIWAHAATCDLTRDQTTRKWELCSSNFSTRVDTNMTTNTTGSFWLKRRRNWTRRRRRIRNKGWSEWCLHLVILRIDRIICYSNNDWSMFRSIYKAIC